MNVAGTNSRRAWPREFRVESLHNANQLAYLALSITFCLSVLLSLIATPRRTGDAHQYLVMAMQSSQLRPPWLSPVEESHYKHWFVSQPAESGFPDGARAIRQPALVRVGQQEFSHFWFYPLLATPAVTLANAIGAHPALAFAITNALLLALALWAATRAFGPLSALTIIASPLIWFIGRAQVEIFTISLLTLAMAAAAQHRWGWASIALAIASTQNMPIAAALPLVWSAAGVDWFLERRVTCQARWPEVAMVRRSLGFALVSVGISLLHPIYYVLRLGVLTPQQLNGGIAHDFPSLDRYLAPVVDPDIGFVAWLPLSAVLAAIGVALALVSVPASGNKARSLLPLFLSLAIAVWLLFVFARTTNVNSGGTVHISRYALWLIPLLLPAISVATRALSEQAPSLTVFAAIGAFALYLGYFHPDQPERYVERSPQATWMLAHLPDLYRPLPEVFVERALHIDGGPRASAADPACQLILLVESTPDQPCPLTSFEQSTIDGILGGDDTAIWIRRGDDGASSLSPAPRQQ